MQLTMTGEYAVRAMIHLSTLPFGTIIQISEVSKEWNIPENFLRKITAQLAGADLITSQRGINGGIRLSRPPESLTVLDVVEAVEGKIFLNKCLICDGFCPRDEWCQVHTLWEEAQVKLKEILSSKNLAQLAADTLKRRAEILEARQQTSAA
ncbi:MAG: Rrf2 family transcriptional regulator [Ignavibacteriae bacterium]|nr:Rrf2 family transcriptional regulator [Ignavibacteriota bacterium]